LRPQRSPIRKEGAARPSASLLNHWERLGEIMIGPPGLPKYGRRVFSFAGTRTKQPRQSRHLLKLATGLYLAGVLAHFSHHLAFTFAQGDPSFGRTLISVPVALVWPADLIGTLISLA
jgi:hypothetical protein